MFETNYNYVPGPYPPGPYPGPYPPPVPPGPPCPPGPGGVYVDPSLTISGAAADAKVTGDLLASKVDLESLAGLSVNLIDNKIELAQYLDAEDGQVPSKTSTGLTWIEVAKQDDIDLINSKINDINSNLSEMASSMEDLVDKVSTNTTAIEQLTASVSEIVSQVDEINSEISTINEELTKKVDQTTFSEFQENVNSALSDLDQRVTNLESCCSELAELKERVSALETKYDQDIENLEDELARQDRRIDSDEERILALENQMTQIDPEKIEKALSDVEEALDSISQYDQRLDDLQYDVGGLKTSVSNLEEHALLDTDEFLLFGGSATEVVIGG